MSYLNGGNIVLGGLTLPIYAELEEQPSQLIAKQRTMNGTLVVDTFANLRAWKVSFDIIDYATWLAIDTLIKSQFTGSGAFLTFVATNPAANANVWVTPSSTKLRWSGSWAEGYSLLLEEQNAVS
jgi:hypothetical protein